MRLLGLASPGPVKLHGGARLRKNGQRQKLMTELEGETKSAQCVDKSRIATARSRLRDTVK